MTRLTNVLGTGRSWRQAVRPDGQGEMDIPSRGETSLRQLLRRHEGTLTGSKGHRSAAVGRNQTSVAKRTCQVRWTEVATPNVWSLATFAIKDAGFSTRRSRKGRRRGRGEEGFWRFAQSPIECCAKRHTVSVASAPPFLLLCVEKLACLPWIGSRDPLSACLDWPTQRCAHLARHCAGSDLGRSAGESVRYRHPGGNSSRVAVIRRISSAEIAEKGRLWRFAQNAQRVPLVIVRPRPALAASSRRSADATKACDD